MKFKYPEIAVCGLSCRLCPSYVAKTKSRCPGCKTPWRLGAACPLLRCAVKRHVEFCGDCPDNTTCEKWKKHRGTGKTCDSFTCYQKLEGNICFIQQRGLAEFRESQKIRERLLKEMLDGFNDGRSRSYFCIVATVLEVDEIQDAIRQAERTSEGLPIKEKAKLLHRIFDDIAQKKNYCLKLRK